MLLMYYEIQWAIIATFITCDVILVMTIAVLRNVVQVKLQEIIDVLMNI